MPTREATEATLGPVLVNENKEDTPAVVATAAVLPSATFSAFSRSSGTSVVVVVTRTGGGGEMDVEVAVVVVDDEDGIGTTPVPLG